MSIRTLKPVEFVDCDIDIDVGFDDAGALVLLTVDANGGHDYAEVALSAGDAVRLARALLKASERAYDRWVG